MTSNLDPQQNVRNRLAQYSLLNIARLAARRRNRAEGALVPESTQLDTFLVEDPAALRAIAHPLRQRILMELSVRGHARAADLAQATGQAANSISFHLRVLANAGMIVEAPEHARDKRDRVWANVATSYRVEPGMSGEQDLILGPTLAWVTETFSKVARRDQPAEARSRSLMLNTLLLSQDEATALAEELEAVLMRRYEQSLAEARAHPEVPRDTYQVLTAVGPREHDAPGGPEAEA